MNRRCRNINYHLVWVLFGCLVTLCDLRFGFAFVVETKNKSGVHYLLLLPSSARSIVTTTTATKTTLFADLMIQRGCRFFSLHYDLVGPTSSTLTTTITKPNDNENIKTNKAPIVVLHGGPGVPSNYLLPLQNEITDRTILFYDQLGCGLSDQPDYEESLYSIPLFVDDLTLLLEETDISDTKFHLYGQSFGGILAFEYLKRHYSQSNHPCLSVTLSGTPTSVPQVEAVANELQEKLLLDDTNNDPKHDVAELFRINHQVQTQIQPKPLKDAYDLAGSAFRGTKAIPDYQATLHDNNGDDGDDKDSTTTRQLLDIPALIMRGERDFVTAECIEGWSSVLANAQFVELEGCSHHGLLERPDLYAQTLETFWNRHEE